MESLTTFYVVMQKHNTPYYPKANGLAESTNKTLQNILWKIVNGNRTDWDTKLHSALWAYQTTYKTSIRTTPFRLAFGLEEMMPIEFQVPSLWIQVRERLSEKKSKKISGTMQAGRAPDNKHHVDGTGAVTKERIRRLALEGQ